ncbi:MAG: L,D-transpeptidase [Anaerolineae bacterium]|nr:L,D-transpeptidase [Anaerolineae bacterium]
MSQLTRRDFLKLTGVTLAGLAIHSKSPLLAQNVEPAPSEPPPTPLGRVIQWTQAVRKSPDPQAESVAVYRRNDLIPLYASVKGEAPWPSNPIWYQTQGGFVHSGYIQPVRDTPATHIIKYVTAPGFWAEVCIPMTEAHWDPDSPQVSRLLYYGTVYRVIAAKPDKDGHWWYRLEDGITWSPGPYVPATSMRRISPATLTPLSPGHPDKWIQINLGEQTLQCFEKEQVVYQTRVSSGIQGLTPRGEFRVLYKRYTRRMTGEDYDLPGIAFPVYITSSGIAIHGTYWHNDFGRPHSHGCLNVPNEAARWVFRWVDPITTYTTYTETAPPGTGTRVVIV